jgi:serine/threonine protein phosphatase PrpC
VAVVADAHFGGSSAEVAVDHLLSSAQRHILSGDWTTTGMPGWIRGALQSANRRVWGERSPSACAVLVVWVHDHQLWWGSVGDCRLYRVRGVNSQVLNPLRNTYLGDHRTPSIAQGLTPLAAGDRLVLASDGLPECRYGRETLHAADVGDVVREQPAAFGVRALVQRAFAGGGEDNIAVVMGLIP